MKPQLVEYYETHYEKYVQEYLVNETEERCYFVSKLTYELAKELHQENELSSVSTYSLPKDWVQYKLIYQKPLQESLNKGREYIYVPQILVNNKDEIVKIVRSNFHYISRIVSFLEEFEEHRCRKDFSRQCIVSWAITEEYLPVEIARQLYEIVFKTYPDLYEKDKLKLLMDARIGHIVSFIQMK